MSKRFYIEDTAVCARIGIEQLSLEQLSFKEAADIFGQIIPELKNKLHDAAKSFVLSFNFLSSSNETKVISHLSSLSYTNLSKTLVSVPEYFNGYFLDYLKTLQKVQNQIENQSLNYLKEYEFILSAFITNKDQQISSSSFDQYAKQIQEKTQEGIAEVSAFFKDNKPLNRQHLDQVVARLSDLNDIDEIAKKISTQHKISHLEEIKTSVEKITKLLDIIIEQIKSNELNKVSQKMALSIASGAQELAQYVEFISLTHFRVTVILKYVKELFDTLAKKI